MTYTLNGLALSLDCHKYSLAYFINEGYLKPTYVGDLARYNVDDHLYSFIESMLDLRRSIAVSHRLKLKTKAVGYLLSEVISEI